MTSLRDLVQTTRAQLDQHSSAEIDDAHEALDVIEDHAKGEDTAEDVDELLASIEAATEAHPRMQPPLAELGRELGVDVDDPRIDDELEALTVDELGDLARELDIEGRSGMNKAELVAAIQDARARGEAQAEDAA